MYLMNYLILREPITYGKMLSLALMQGGGDACSCFNLICYSLLIPKSDLTPSEWRGGKGGAFKVSYVEGMRARRQGKLWLIGKIK